MREVNLRLPVPRNPRECRACSATFRRSVLSILLAVSLASLPGFGAAAQGHQSSSTSTSVEEARVNPQTRRFAVVSQNDLHFSRLSTSDGLSQMRVASILQDDKGFIWTGTQYGLNRYDGYTFKTYLHEPGNPNSLSGVFINSLFKDRSGALWIGCDQFLDKFDPATERFVHYHLEPENGNRLPSAVMHISQDSTGTLWLATGSGLYSLDPANGHIQNYSHHPNDPSSLSGDDVKSSGEDRMGNFWVATEEGLDQFDRKSGKVTLHIPLRESLRESTFHQDRFGVFWIVHTSGNGIAIFDPKTNTLTHCSFHDRDPSSTAVSGVKTILEDNNGNMWFGTQGAGLLRFDREHSRFIAYQHNAYDPSSLAEDSINSLFQDREGNIWAGLEAVGLNRFASEPLPFQGLPHDLGRPNSKGETFINAVFSDHNQNLWIATRDALHRIDRASNQYAVYRIADGISIAEAAGFLWIGTYSHGLYRFDSKTKQFKAYQHIVADPYSLSNDVVARLLVDHNGTLWVATYDGLDRFDPATERFTTYRYEPIDRNVFYLDLTEAPNGIFWLGTHASGLQRFDPATGQFTAYRHEDTRPGSLGDNRVTSVHLDRNGTVWVGTQNGLARFDSARGSFTAYTDRDGLRGNAISCILEAEDGDLWMSTNNGVSRFSPTRKTFKNYSTADGLAGPDLTGFGACTKSADGQMFFGGFSGGTRFYPSTIQDSSYAPAIVLTDFRLSGNPVKIGSSSPIKNSITYTSDLTLSHEQNVFSIAFAALSYPDPATNRYRYRLQGLERAWNEVGGDRRLATYTTLPAGVYTFSVQGATRGGPWSEPGLALHIRILPPWWGTWWFKTICAALVCFGVFTVYSYRLRRIARQFEIRLEERVAERTRISRELHDTLIQSAQGLILVFQGFAGQLLKPDLMRRKMETALDQADHLLNEARARVTELRTAGIEDDILQGLTRAGKEIFANESVQFSIVTAGTPRLVHQQIADEICRIGREALLNAETHANAKAVEVEVTFGATEFRLRVRDDGCGISGEVLTSGSRPQHFGLQGMRERAQRIGARFNLWTAEKAGTEIDVVVPAAAAYAKQDMKRHWPASVLARLRFGASRRGPA